MTGSIDPGLLIIEGRPSDQVSLEEAERKIWEELQLLKTKGVSERELQKWKNKVESTLAFSELSILNKAINLAYFELLGDANMINEEVGYYRQITKDDIARLSNQLLTEENCSELYYKASAGEVVEATGV